MLDLGAYLASVGGKPWVWGRADCCTFPADWLVLCGRADPMEDWRGTYTSEEDCASLIATAGGLLPLCITGMGEPSHCEPAMGDVGIVQMWGHEAGAIYLGQRWAVRSQRGWAAASFAPGDITAVWRNG